MAFVDSSFLTLPEIADLLVIAFTIKHPDQWWYFAAMTTTGSIAGSLALYAIGRKGGEALVRRGFHERHVDRGLAWYRRYGALVLIVPAILPPPTPFKAFVLLAGVSGVRPAPFALAVLVGRGARYGGEAWLARHYGNEALVFVQANAFTLVAPVFGITLVGLLAWWGWRRFRRGRRGIE